MNNTNNRSKISHQEVIKRYLNKESSVKIAKIAGISPAGVFRILKYNHIKSRPKAEAEKLKRICNHEEIVKDYRSGMFLSQVAKKHGIGDSHALKILRDNGIKSRGREGIRRGDKHPFWKGGKTHDRDGYVIEKLGRTHRLEVEKAIGRKLNNWESVHHVDNNKRNYELSNLVIIPSREHIRFHTLLRQLDLPTNRENLEKFCRKESDIYFRFTVADFINICGKLNIKLKSINRNKRKKCIIKDCANLRSAHGLCSKHYQRRIAKKRGYWKSGGSRTTPFLGKFSREKNLLLKNT